MKQIYFPSLNGIRAIAALMVFIYHTEIIKSQLGIFNLSDFTFIKRSGNLGVTLFFVLSGFLITYLLLREKHLKKTINIWQFYMRRILRIWPLYFLLIFLTIFYNIYINDEAFNYTFFRTKLILYCTFLANVAWVLFSAGGFPSQLWSVASEEQFYFVWPHIIKRKTKLSATNIFTFAIVYATIRYFFYILSLHYKYSIFSNIDLISFIWKFQERFRIDCMAIGATAAYIYFYKTKYPKFIEFIYSTKNQIIIYSLTLFFYISPFIKLWLLQDTLFSLFFSFIIINVATNSNSIFNLENNIFNFLGKISYGLYVYQFLVFFIIENHIKTINGVHNNILISIYYTILSLILTIGISFISYKYYELPFLKWKLYFSSVLSGDFAK